MPLMLTKQERKKLRKRNRAEMQREKLEKQLLGLIPAPPPKVKITNMMRVLGTQAIMDPTEVEKEVKAQMEARQKAHDERNQARKLTAEERKEKKAKKVAEDIGTEIRVALFKT